MALFQISTYILAVLLTFLTTSLAYRLTKKSSQNYFHTFFFFIIANNLICILDIVFRYFPTRAMMDVSLDSSATWNMLWGFIIIPLMVAFTYFFAAFFYRFSLSKPPKFLKILFWLYWSFLVFIFITTELHFFKSGNSELAEIRIPVFDIGVVICFFLPIIQALFHSTDIQNPKHRRLVRITGIYYLMAGCIFFAMNSSMSPIRIYLDILARSLLGLTFNLPIIIWFYFHLIKQEADLKFQPPIAENLSNWLIKKNISSREKEILDLILQGKTNRAIEDELFISRRTVETHIYNIYRKLGVKNRIQLINVISKKK